MRPLFYTVRDHNGKFYPSLKSMCKAYGITIGQYQYRIRHGLTSEEALLLKKGKHIRKIKEQKTFTDHRGTRFPTEKDMCNYYGVNPATYCKRIKAGWTIDEALTGNKDLITDPYGNIFSSREDMCKFHKISSATFKQRIVKGFSMKEALNKTNYKRTKEGFSRGKQTTGPKGEVYISVKAMCTAYDTPYPTFYKRKKRGYSLDACLGLK